jgi:hypothetical protein
MRNGDNCLAAALHFYMSSTARCGSSDWSCPVATFTRVRQEPRLSCAFCAPFRWIIDKFATQANNPENRIPRRPNLMSVQTPRDHQGICFPGK